MKSDREHATRHRDHVGRPEIGAAWSKRSEKCRVTSPSHLALPPAFNIAIQANLFDEEGDEGSSFAGGGRKNG
ncbi:DUF736 family protein [Bradyrhizobium sp. USDA 4506]